jgi:microcystin-dependent protein
MAVASSTSRTQYDCNGSVQDFPFTFGVGQSSEIQVILTDSSGTETILTETSHYTVSATNDDYSSGGTVSTVSTYATGNTVTILRNVPLTQEADFTEGMPTLYETFETGLDKLTRTAQQQEEKITRSVKVPKSESTTGMTIPAAATRASKYLAFDSEGGPIASGGGPGSSDVPVSTYGAALIAAADAAGARDVLSASAVLVGEIKMYAGSSAPDGWLICNGLAISRTEYADLFEVIGTAYGVGDGSTTFNVPSFQGRIPIGVGQGYKTADYSPTGTNWYRGLIWGEETHTQAVGEIASHGHSVSITDPGHTHGIWLGTGTGAGGHMFSVMQALTYSGALQTDGGNPVPNECNLSASAVATAAPTAMDIMNPVLVVNFIIKY